ncbi:MAG: rod shape-determining protein MreC [Desulfovibrionaceae bacterium]
MLFLFLGLYSWNQRTRALDDVASEVGLEVLHMVFTPLHDARRRVEAWWRDYVHLVDVQRENVRLRERVEQLEADLLRRGEERAELKRLRELLALPLNDDWQAVAATVLTGRMGPNAVLESVTVNRGYLAGAVPGTPLLARRGLVGRILRASAHTATVLLLVDPGCRVAVRGQQSRATGILAGRGAQHALEVRFVDRTQGLTPGELLVTSGLDGAYPRGIPVARVLSAKATEYSQFMQVRAVPLVQMQNLEDVLLLEYKGILPPAERVFEEPAESPDSPLIQGPEPAPAS